MLPSEKFGFFGPLAWLADQEWYVIVLACLIITPVMMIVIAPPFESRWLPLDPDHQFRSFFPGDFFLSLAVANALMWGRHLPDRQAWYSRPWFHCLVFVCALLVAVALTALDTRTYPTRAVRSPTKLYHNLVLYGMYGYVGAVALGSLLLGGVWGGVALTLLIGSPWAFWLVTDNNVTEAVRLSRIQSAHVTDWQPLWKSGWKIRRSS